MNQGSSKIRTIEIYSVLMLDVLAVVCSYFLAHFCKFKTVQFSYKKEMYTIVLLLVLLFCVLYTLVVNHSDKFLKRGYLIEFVYVTKYVACLFVTMASILFLTKMAEDYSRLMFGFFIVFTEILTLIFHLVWKKYMKSYYRDEKNQVKLLVITEKEYLAELQDMLKERMDIVYQIFGHVLWDADEKECECPGTTVLGNADNYLERVKLLPLDEVFIYLPGVKKKEISEIINTFQMMGVICHYNIDVADIHTNVRTIDNMAGFNVVTYSMNPVDYNKRMIKRLMDIAGALVGSLITVVLYPFIAIAIKAESKGPVLFRQKRVGRNGRVFSIYKFRSMYMDAEERKKELEAQNEMSGLMFKMDNDPRITKVGAFLRKTSLDELPQFFNILKGDMSLVGTRPPTVDEYERYNFHYKRRLSMTPGLTGMWQVSGRSEITDFDDVVKYDLEYIDHWSLSLDVKILFQTVGVVLMRKGSK